MGTKATELTRSYRLPGTPGGLDLAAAPWADRRAAVTRPAFDTVYYDTADRRLAAAGASLCRNRDGAPGWTLWLPTTDGGRTLRRSGKRPEPPKAVVDLTLVHTRGRVLAPVLHLRSRRSTTSVTDERGTVIGDAVLDRVSAHLLGESATVDSWYDLDITVRDTPGLAAIDTWLRQAGARPNQPDHVPRLLRDQPPQPAEPADDRAAGSPASGRVVLAYLRKQLAALVSNDTGVRLDEPDSVHQMRVATRRSRSALQAFGAVIDREHTRWLVAELRWLAGVLAEVRDREVLYARLLTDLAATPDELLVGDVTGRTRTHFTSALRRARRRVLNQLTGQRYVDLLDALDRLLADPPFTQTAAEPAAEVLPALVARTYRRMERAVTRIDADPGERRDVTIHDARKAAKRARYAVEVAAPVLDRRARGFTRRLKDFQQLLGEHQDTVVTRGALAELAADPDFDRGAAFGLGLLHCRESAAAVRLERGIPAAWRRVANPRRRRWMTR